MSSLGPDGTIDACRLGRELEMTETTFSKDVTGCALLKTGLEGVLVAGFGSKVGTLVPRLGATERILPRAEMGRITSRFVNEVVALGAEAADVAGDVGCMRQK